MLTILPLLAVSAGRQARVMSHVPRTLMLITRSQVSMSISSRVLPPMPVAMAALLTRPSRWPACFTHSSIDAAEARSTGTKSQPSSFAVCTPWSSTSAMATLAPASSAARAKARPSPRAPPVMRMRLFFSGIEGAQLFAGLHLQEAPHARHAHVVLVEELAAPRIWRHVLEQRAVLLEHVPVQAFEPVAVEKAPHVALPALHLSAAPEEHLRMFGIDRRGEADDIEGTARAVFLLVGNRKTHPRGAAFAPFHPVEVDAFLVRLFEHQAGRRHAHVELRALVALRHRMRLRMEVGAMHRVHDVLDGVAVIAFPRRGAQERRPFGRGELLGKLEGRRFAMKLIAEIDEHCAVRLFRGIALHRLLAHQRAILHRRHIGDDAVAFDLHAVVPACQ